MRLDRFIQVLLPHDEKFYSFFEESTRNLLKAGEVLKKLSVSTSSDRQELVNQMHEIEHEGDSITHQIFAELNATFVTPFDREDIHVLASAVDDVLDYIDGTAARVVLYKLKEFPDEMKKLIDILYNSIIELQRGIPLLRDLRKAEELERILQKIN